MGNEVDAGRATETPGGAAPADNAPQPIFAPRLAAAGEMLRSATPAESPVAAIARALLVVTEADHAAIFFRSPTGAVTCPWSHNLSEQYVAELVTPDGVNPWIHILRHPELACMDLPKTRRRIDPAPWILRDVLAPSSDHAALLDRFVRENLRATFVWPLSKDGRVIAALACYYDTPHECPEEEQQAMRAFAAQATAVLGDDPAPTGSPVRRDAHQTLRTGQPRRASTGIALADRPATTVQHPSAAEAAGLAAERAAVEADAHRLAGERAKLAAAWQELEAAQAHAREARQRVAAEQQQLAHDRRAVEDERGRLTDAQRGHAAERDRLADAQRRFEVERAQLAEARAAFDAERARNEGDGKRLTAARTEAANEETRLAADRNRLHEEHTRLETLGRDLNAQEVRLAGDRAALEAETRRVADSQAALTAEQDRLADTRRALEAEAVRLSAERQALDAERARPAQTPVPPEAAVAEPPTDRHAAKEEEKHVRPVQEVDTGPTQSAELAGETTTYAGLVERAGAADVSDIDKQIVAVARHLDARSGHVADYGKRLAEWAEALARALRCSDQDVASTRRAALLHDIGKINVPEATLKKTAAPTDDELGMLEQEPAIAHQVLKDAEGLSDVATILYHRFERWDGAGHPDRLKGKAIPLGARVLAVVNAYGEMITGRPGVPKLYYRDAIAGLQRESGKRFDPEVAAAFCRIVARG